MEKNTDYFDGRSEAEKMQNVANMIHDIVNPKAEEPETKTELLTAEGQEPEESTEPEVDAVVDLVGKAISQHKPKGVFMQTVNTDDSPKL